MEDHFVTYNQALALKKLGFDEPCFAGYRDSAWIGTDGPNSRYFHAQLFSNHQFDDDQKEYCSAPLKSQVFEWGRREYGLHHVVHHFEHKKDTPQEFLAEVSGQLVMLNDDISCFSYHSTYEEAESACIDKLIDIIKKK